VTDPPRSYPTPVGVDERASISSERWALLEPLIDAALDLPPEERDAYFDRASDGDPSLRAQLARLVAACERDDALLDAPAGERFAALLEETPPRILNGRFVIEREIGRGGMAVVYLALDRKHDRQVAVKILGPDAAAAIGADRFDREIKFAARLHHPNIVPLYDSGDEQGWLYYVMPVMRGGSLRQRLTSGTPLSSEVVQRIVREIAAALSHAHEQNVVHRDVKPENILFDGERAMLADFGVARPPLSVGASAGTPEYMSPEQADGRGPVDARSDVYSLAVVVQEMLGRSWMDASDPSLMSSTDVPWSAHDVLRRALARDAAARFPSSSSFEHAFSAAFAIAGSRRATRRWVVGGAIGFVAAVCFAAYAVMATRGHRPNSDAFDLYLRGTDQRLFRSDSGTRAAVGILGRAVAADSLFPAGFAALARAYNAVCLGGEARPARLVACDSGAVAARRAIALDSSLADGYGELAWASLNRLDFSTAEAAARHGVVVEPDNSEAHQFVAAVDFWLGRVDEAIAESRRSVALSPRAIDAIAHHGRILAMAGLEDEALVVVQPLQSLRPKVRRVSETVESIYEERKMWRDAMVEAGNDSGRIARILAESGRGSEARAIVGGLEARWNVGHGRAWDVAGVFFGLHEYDSAFTWLNRSVDDLTLRVDIFEPGFAAARSDPRFRDLMRRVGLAARR
jgi:hypothetical protein